MALIVIRLLVSVMLMPFVILARSSSNSETNEITEFFHHEQEDKYLPECAGNTICAYLQANARGINVQQLCTCKGANQRCPLTWDSDDGHSITQGSDQYKYCRKAPELETCQRGMTAYTTHSLYSKSAKSLVWLSDVNHCLCPERANYEVVDSKYDDVDDDVESMETSYVCNPLKTCGAGDACKYITETSNTYLVNPKCRCPGNNACPSVATNRNSRRFTETVRFGNGQLHTVYCH